MMLPSQIMSSYQKMRRCRRHECVVPGCFSSLNLYLDCPFFQNSRRLYTHLVSLSPRDILSVKSFLTNLLIAPPPPLPHYQFFSVFSPFPYPGSG